MPAADGIQTVPKGTVVAGTPTWLPLAMKRTEAMVPSMSVAMAVRLTRVPPLTLVAEVGLVRATTGEVPEETTMERVAEVVWEPRLSVATAESV